MAKPRKNTSGATIVMEHVRPCDAQRKEFRAVSEECKYPPILNDLVMTIQENPKTLGIDLGKNLVPVSDITSIYDRDNKQIKHGKAVIRISDKELGFWRHLSKDSLWLIPATASFSATAMLSTILSDATMWQATPAFAALTLGVASVKVVLDNVPKLKKHWDQKDYKNLALPAVAAAVGTASLMMTPALVNSATWYATPAFGSMAIGFGFLKAAFAERRMGSMKHAWKQRDHSLGVLVDTADIRSIGQLRDAWKDGEMVVFKPARPHMFQVGTNETSKANKQEKVVPFGRPASAVSKHEL